MDGNTNGVRKFMRELFYVSVHLSFVFYVFRPTVKLVIRCTPEGKPRQSIFTTIITHLFLFSVCIGKWFGNYMLLVLAPFGSALFEKLESTDNNLLLPFFVIAYGMRVSTINIFGKKNALTSSNARCFVSVVKFVVCLLPPLCSKPTKDVLALASIMRCKGVLELGIFSFLSDKRVLHSSQ